MRRWSELAERVAATTRTSEKTALLADYLRSLTPDELPIAAVFLTGPALPRGRPADRPGSAGRRSSTAVGAGRRRHPRGPRRGLRPPLRPRAWPSRTCCRRPATPRRPRLSPTLPEVAATFAAIEAASGPAAKAALLRDLLERADPRDRQGHRQGARRRAAHRAARGPRRGRHRQGLRPPARRRSSGPAC